MKTLLIVVFSVALWQLIDRVVPPKTAEKLHRVASTVFWWLIIIFVIGGVIGLLSFGWDHLGK